MATKSIVEDYYDHNAEREWARLDRHRTEFAVTMRALVDYLPPAPAPVADIGGGPGRYAIALTHRGYPVTLVDLSAANLALARQQAAAAGVTLADTVHANCLDLSQFASGTFAAILLMGPLYHLLTAPERQQAVVEAIRILQPGGVIFTAFLSRFAAFRYAGRYDVNYYLNHRAGAEQLWRTGLNDQMEAFPAYFTHPSEIMPLMDAVGLRTLMVVGCEGAVSMCEEGVNGLQGAEWEAWADLNYLIGKDPWSHGASEHLLHVGVKP